MENHIFYPGHDPVDRQDLKTFICQADDIVFYFHSSAHQHWNFTNGFDRDQAFAFLIDQYTDRQSFLQHEEKSSDPVISAVIGLEEIVLSHKSGAKTDPELTGYLFHLFVLDLVHSPDIKHTWSDKARIPYPYSQLKQHR